MKKKFAGMTGLFAGLSCLAAETVVTVDFWDAKKIDWGDGRLIQQPVTKTSPKPQGYICDYTVRVPETGWYELLFSPNFARNVDLIIDGKAEFIEQTGAKLKKENFAKNGNVWLTKGTHNIRLQRVGRPAFPLAQYEFFKLRKSDPSNAEQNIKVSKGCWDVVRQGETLEVKVTAGGTGKKTEYEFVAVPYKSKAPEKEGIVLGSATFVSSDVPESRTLQLTCPKSGAFVLAVREKGGKFFEAGSIPFGQFHAVNVSDFIPGSGKTELIHTVDCVKQTIDGKPIEPGCFVEANGPSRVVTTKAGTYREGHDCTAPLGAGLTPNGEYPKKNASGFSYEFSIPKADVPYVIEIEYPDDTRRSVAILGQGGYGSSGGKGYETGFNFPISNTMKTLKFIAFPTSKSLVNGKMRLAFITVPYMERAAVSKIRISRFSDDIIPVTKVPAQGGRQYSLWWEEGGTWDSIVGEAKTTAESLDRFVRFARYHGATAISLPALSYQGVMCRSDKLVGYGRESCDLVRLMALTCERYGMEFLPEVFPTQWYWRLKYIPTKVKNSRDVHEVNLYGAENKGGVNPAHPEVQKFWIEGLGEVADKLRDCKAFTGMQLRADTWLFASDFMFSGLEQGYDDWTIAKFTKDTGIKVPGRNNDPASCMKRFTFLTAPKMLPKWNAWRCKTILDYHRKLHKRIAGDRNDITLGVCGSFNIGPASSTKFQDKISSRAVEVGIDPKTYNAVEGLYLAPYSRYGTGSHGETPSVLKSCVDPMRDPDVIAFGKGKFRSYGFYFSYQEFGRDIPQDKLGFKNKVRFWYCAAVNGSGRDFLAKFAGVLGEQDMMFARDGGDNDPFGDADISREWFKTFNKIPNVPFDDLKFAFDPVTVRSKDLKADSGFFTLFGSDKKAFKDVDAGFYFYAVNKEYYPAEIKLTFDKDRTFTDLSSGREVKTEKRTITLKLKPYDLLVFRGENGAVIKKAATSVPKEQVTLLKNLLSNAQTFRYEMEQSGESKTFGAKNWKKFCKKTDFAWKEFVLGHFWRARTAIQSGDVYQIYHDAGRVPSFQIALPFPEHIQFEASPQWYADYKVIPAKTLKSAVNSGITESTVWNKEWTGDQVLNSKGGVIEIELNIPSECKYDIEAGIAAASRAAITADIDGIGLPGSIIVDKLNNPEAQVFFSVNLKEGVHKLTFRQKGKFGVYALRLRPKFVPVPGRFWASVGPFRRTPYQGQGKEPLNSQLKRIFASKFVPVDKVNPKAQFTTLATDKKISWTLPSMPPNAMSNDHIVHTAHRVGSKVHRDSTYAALIIVSDRDRTAPAAIAGDWEVEAWLNGVRVKSDKVLGDPALPGFGGWRYVPIGILNLKKGENLLILQACNGSLGAGWAIYLADDPGLKVKSVNLKK